MSTIRDPAYITNAGRTMMTAGGEVTYTKAVLYGQDISGLSDSQIKALTSLGNPLREVKIGVSDKQSSDSGSTVILEAVFQNSDLKADLEYKAVGFFARKNDVEQLVIVAVANQGAYLAATNPDGVATDALDLKIAVKIGDATSVTAVIDPAGSVTPASLNSAIKQATQELTAKIDTKSNSQDVQNALNQKADKSTVEDSLATKANVTDLNQLSSELAKKAESSYLANLVTEVNKKANSDDVTAQISDVNKSINAVSDTVTKNKDTIDKQIASLTTTVNAKVDASYSYSREELDKKFLALSVSADGKMSAEQVTSMIATKADKSYVDEKLDEKADESSVDAKINAIDFSKIGFTKQYITNANGDTDHHTWFAKRQSDGTWTIDITDVSSAGDWTAAIARNNKRDIANLQSSKANSSEVYTKKQVDDAFSSRDATIATKADKSYVDSKVAGIDFSKIKFRKQYVTGDNKPADGTWQATKNADGTYTIDLWHDDWTAAKLADVLAQLPNKVDTSTVNAQIADVKNTAQSSDNQIWGEVNKLSGKQTVDKADANNLTASGTYYISNPNQGKNFPTGSWGNLLVSNGNDHRTSQLYFPDDGGCFWFRVLDENSWHNWVQVADKADITNLRNLVNQQNQTIQSLTTRLTNAENEIRYIKANYVEGRTFPASQEAQAEAWENENPQRIAFITK